MATTVRSGARTASAAASASTSRSRPSRCTRQARRLRTSARHRSEIQGRISDQYADAASRTDPDTHETFRRKRLARGCSSRSTKASTSARSTAIGSRRLAANPHLKVMFGYSVEAPEQDVRPFELERFVDPQARDGFFGRLQRDGAVRDYLLRLRRADKTPMWVEVTAHAERGRDRLARRSARCVTSASASASRIRRAISTTSCCRPRSSRRSGRRSRASRTSSTTRSRRSSPGRSGSRSARPTSTRAAASTRSSASRSAPRRSSATC